MINIMYVTTYGPVRVYMRKCLCFFFYVFMIYRPPFFFGGGGAGLSKRATHVCIGKRGNFMFKFALHDVKLLRQNGQWGGERGRGV